MNQPDPSRTRSTASPDGGPAFPLYPSHTCEGMTLRDYLAAAALDPLVHAVTTRLLRVAQPGFAEATTDEKGEPMSDFVLRLRDRDVAGAREDVRAVAKVAYQLADAMLEARSRRAESA